MLDSPFFCTPEIKDFPFFHCRATPSKTVPKTQFLEVAFSLLERADLRSQKDRILGKRIAGGRAGWTLYTKKGRRMRKKRWVVLEGITQLSRDMLQNGVSHRCACVKLSTKRGVLHHFGEAVTSLKKYRAIRAIAAIVSQYREIWGH